MTQIKEKDFKSEKLPRVKSIQKTVVPPGYPTKTILWLVEFNSPRKPSYEK